VFARHGFFLLALCAASSCSGRTELALDPDRDALFAIVTNGSVQRDHVCQVVRDAEVSAQNQLLPESIESALRARIDSAKLADVQRCLAEVQSYNDCYLDLPCDAFASGTLPAWLLGSALAPCGCGVDTEKKVSAGPYALRSPLPDTLAACTGILPTSPPPPSPGEACP